MMSKTALTLSEPVAKMLKLFTAKSQGNMHAQSRVAEEALIESFHVVKSGSLGLTTKAQRHKGISSAVHFRLSE